MSKEVKTPKPKVGSDIGTIREILMGQHIAAFEARFDAIEALIKDVQSRFEVQLDTIKADMDAQFGEASMDRRSRLEELEQKFDREIDQLNTQMGKVRKADKSQLSEMLALVSKQLKDD